MFSIAELKKFIMVGAVTGVFYVSLFTGLWRVLHINYNVAVTIAYGIALVVYFYAHRQFTFKSQDNAVTPQIGRYICMVMLNYMITLAVVRCAVEVLLLPPYLGVVSAIAVTSASSYLISKFWIFRQGTLVSLRGAKGDENKLC